MPIYEYKCADCGAHLEKLQKATDEPLKTCGECGGTLEKQWSLSGFQFKGEGWYVTDYARKDSTEPAAKSGDKSTESKDSASKKPTEKKPEPKKEKTPAAD